MAHHSLDPYPIPKERLRLYINEPWLIDKSLIQTCLDTKEPDSPKDNVRVYIPLDINKDAILRRLHSIITHYGEANEKNESDFSLDVDMLILQIEIYNQIWYERHMPPHKQHSAEATSLVREFIKMLEEIPDGCAELFPFETIDALKKEYLLTPSD